MEILPFIEKLAKRYHFSYFVDREGNIVVLTNNISVVQELLNKKLSIRIERDKVVILM